MKAVPLLGLDSGDNRVAGEFLRDTTSTSHWDKETISSKLVVRFVWNPALLLPFFHIVCDILLLASGVDFHENPEKG